MTTEPLFECVPNFSEGRRPELLVALADAMAEVPGVKLLGREQDPSHNRAVITVAGPGAALVEAAVRAARAARDRIDLTRHAGVHPRIGSMDVCPFVPLGAATMLAAVALARAAGQRIGAELAIPVFLYGFAASHATRRELSAFRNPGFEALCQRVGCDPAWAPDFGPARLHPTAGAVAVGARRILVAFNVDLDSGDVAVARAIAARVRERDGGLPGVRALGLLVAHRGVAQVSMNLVDHERTPPLVAFEAVQREAARLGVGVRESELIGLAPRAAIDERIARLVRLRDFDPATRILEEALARA